MLYLTYSNNTIEFSENILKISTLLEELEKYRSSEEDPLYLDKCNDEIFGIFKEWFNMLENKGVVKQNDKLSIIFEPNFFKSYNIKTLIGIFNFALANQIKILCDTITFVIGLKCDVVKVNEKYFAKNDEECCKLYDFLAIMILKNMKKEHFESLSDSVKELLTFNPKEVIPYSNFEIKEEYIWSVAEDTPKHKYCIIPYNLSRDFSYVCDDMEKFPVETIVFPQQDYNNLIDLFNFRNLTYIDVPDNIKGFEDDFDFMWCRKLNFIYNDTICRIPINTNSFVIPTNITKIGNESFQDCKHLSEIVIPENVKEICYCAFNGCNLIRISIPTSVSKLGEYAFYGCQSLTNIVIPSTISKIDKYAFESCTSLSNINIPESVNEIEYSAFCYCSSLKNIVITSNVSKIGKNTFEACTQLTSVSLPSSLTSIDFSAFCNCINLTSIDLPEGLKSIDKNVFCGCTKLTNIVLPDSVTEIGDSAFTFCPLPEDIKQKILTVNNKAFDE